MRIVVGSCMEVSLRDPPHSIGIGNRMLEDRHLGPGIGNGKGRFFVGSVSFSGGLSFRRPLCLSVTFAQRTQSKDYVLTPAAWNWVAKDRLLVVSW